MQERLEFRQCATVNVTLEIDNLFNGRPVIHPPPVVELGSWAHVQADPVIFSHQAQQEPDLLLAPKHTPVRVTQITLRYFVAQPLARTTDHTHVGLL